MSSAVTGPAAAAKTSAPGAPPALADARYVVVPSAAVSESTARNWRGPACTLGCENQPWPSMTPRALQPARTCAVTSTTSYSVRCWNVVNVPSSWSSVSAPLSHVFA